MGNTICLAVHPQADVQCCASCGRAQAKPLTRSCRHHDQWHWVNGAPVCHSCAAHLCVQQYDQALDHGRPAPFKRPTVSRRQPALRTIKAGMPWEGTASFTQPYLMDKALRQRLARAEAAQRELIFSNSQQQPWAQYPPKSSSEAGSLTVQCAESGKSPTLPEKTSVETHPSCSTYTDPA